MCFTHLCFPAMTFNNHRKENYFKQYFFKAYCSDKKLLLDHICGKLIIFFPVIYPSFNTHTIPLVSSAAGLVEIEEGELTGQQLSLQSLQLARTSFAKEPYVKQVKTHSLSCRNKRIKYDTWPSNLL